MNEDKIKNTRKIIVFFSLLFIVLIAIFIISYFYQNKHTTDYAKIDTKGTNLVVEYNEEELTGEWSEYIAKINLSDEKTTIDGKGVKFEGNTITISSEGTYYITGSISDGNIIVDAGKNNEVQLVLDNASITSKQTAPINGISASKLTITLAENSENNITDNDTYTTFTDTENSEPDGAIFTKTDLIINGKGTLNIVANYLDGIVSKDGLKIISSNINVNSKDDGINIAGGNDSSAMNSRQGQNSFNDVGDSNRKLVINNGEIFVNSSGDGLDSNGSIYIYGGNITVAGPTNSGNSALDYDGECVVTGGNLIIYGTYGMWQNPSTNSTQYSLTFQTSGNAEDVVSLKDSSGVEIANFKVEKSYGVITISNSNIKQGNTYTLYVNGTSIGSLEANSIITTNSPQNNGGMNQNSGNKQPKRGF